LVEEKVKLQREYIENITSNNQEQIEESQKKIDKANIEIVKLNEKIVILIAEIVNLTVTIEHHDKTQGKYETYLKFSGQLEDRLKKITKEMEFYSENQHCPTCRQGIEESFKCEIIETRTVTKTELEEAVSQLAGKIAAVQKELREIHEVQKEISEHQRKIGTHNSEINVLNRLIAEKSKEIDSLHKKFSEDRNEHSRLDALLEEQMIYNEKRESLVTEKATFDIAQVLLKDGGIKAKIIAQYIPVINSAINKYLTLLDLFVQFELDENFDEKIKSRYREEFSYDSFSEGEKMRLNLAVTFAWRAIAKMRNSSNTNLLIFDEISDGSLDQDGREGFIKIIKDIANQGTHVWVISHNEGMADKLSSSVKFEKVKNYSRIVEG